MLDSLIVSRSNFTDMVAGCLIPIRGECSPTGDGDGGRSAEIDEVRKLRRWIDDQLRSRGSNCDDDEAQMIVDWTNPKGGLSACLLSRPAIRGPILVVRA